MTKVFPPPVGLQTRFTLVKRGGVPGEDGSGIYHYAVKVGKDKV